MVRYYNKQSDNILRPRFFSFSRETNCTKVNIVILPPMVSVLCFVSSSKSSAVASSGSNHIKTPSIPWTKVDTTGGHTTTKRVSDNCSGATHPILRSKTQSINSQQIFGRKEKEKLKMRIIALCFTVVGLLLLLPTLCTLHYVIFEEVGQVTTSVSYLHVTLPHYPD